MFDWALEANAPRPHPESLLYREARWLFGSEKLVHWERAVVQLRRHGVTRAEWPAPFENRTWPDPSKVSPTWRAAVCQVHDDRRRELLRDCAELRCREHVYFSQSELNGLLFRTADMADALTRAPVTARTLGSEDAVYVYGEDAVEWLLREDLVPSKWPYVYEVFEDAAEPERIAVLSDGIRRLFRGESPGKLFVLQHRLLAMCPNTLRAERMHTVNQVIAADENRMRAAAYSWALPPNLVFTGPSSANSIVEQFNRRVAGLRRVPDASLGGQPRESSAGAPASIEAPASPQVPSMVDRFLQAAAPAGVETAEFGTIDSSPRKARGGRRSEWHDDIADLMKTRPNLSADAAIPALCELRKGYEYNDDPDGGYLLVLPGGQKIRRRTVQTLISRLRDGDDDDEP